MLSVLDGVEMDPENIGAALNSLEMVAARLRARGDARAVFPDVYAVITRKVKTVIEGPSGPAFLEPQWISKLAGLFCRLYLKALSASLDGSQPAGAAWDAAFARGGAGGALASVEALLGINAHINFDLAQGLFDNIVNHEAVNNPRLLARYRHDHDLVNGILAASMHEILTVLMQRYQCPLATTVTRSRSVEDTASRLVMFTLRQWRDQVWDDVEEMLAAKGRLGVDTVLARTNRSSGRIGRAILAGNNVLAFARPRARVAARALQAAA